MKTEIILRSYTTDYIEKYMNDISNIIRENTNFNITIIDHSNITLNDIEYDESEFLISIDKFLANKFEIPYFRMSRLFDITGNIISRQIGDYNSYYEIHYSNCNNRPIRILDTDKVSGENIKLASTIFCTNRTTTLLDIKEHQDLIDLEDLIDYNSLFKINESLIEESNYMKNEYIFHKRTSLPISLFEKIKKILEN